MRVNQLSIVPASDAWKLASWLVVAIFLLPSAQGQDRARPADHVVLISIDGLRPDFYLESSRPMPTLRQMAAAGAHAKGVRGVFPTVTYPSHTTLVTGALPKSHGIYYNSPFEPEGQTGRWYWNESEIQVPTLWDAVREAGLISASLMWPVSVGAPVDYNVPEIWSLEDGYGSIQALRDNETPRGLLAEMETEVLGRMSETTFNGDYLNREDRISEMAAYLLERYKPNLTTVHLLAVDHFQHDSGREGIDVERSLVATDRAIHKIVEAADRAGILERTTFVVTGDHGFVDLHTRLSPNVWLAQAGLIEPKRDRGDWRAAFHATGSAFLHLRDPDDSEALRAVQQVLGDLPARHKKLFRVVERDELDHIGADPNAVLALAPMPGVTMSWRADGDVLTRAWGGGHGFYPDTEAMETGFVAWGAGISRDTVIPRMNLEDIAPLVAELLGLDFTAPAGVAYPGVIRYPPRD